MRTLYLDCGMGAAGDMLMAALLELVDDKAAFLEKMNGLGLPGVAVSAVPAVKCGITGTHVAVTVHGEEEVSCDVSPEGHIHHHDHSHELVTSTATSTNMAMNTSTTITTTTMDITTTPEWGRSAICWAIWSCPRRYGPMRRRSTA